MTDSDQVVGLTETISAITDRSDSIQNVLDEQTEATG